MNKKYKFNFYNGLLTTNSSSEIIELDENLSENEVEAEFAKWFLAQLDTRAICGKWEEVEEDEV